MKLLRQIKNRAGFFQEFLAFSREAAQRRPELPVTWKDRWPQLNDRTATISFDQHYVYHTAWGARAVSQIQPSRHVDISSYIYFATITSAFVPVDFYDFRPAPLELENLTSRQADVTNLEFADRSIESLSCMHVIEHIGLGRYNDPLDAQGDLKALSEIERVTAPGGSLLVVVPVGKPRVQYNAHRIYSPAMIRDALPELSLHEFALLPDDTSQGLVYGADDSLVAKQRYGCGCFWFKRPGP